MLRAIECGLMEPPTWIAVLHLVVLYDPEIGSSKNDSSHTVDG